MMREHADAGTVFKKPPFRIDEKGWGEFDMSITLTAIAKGGDHTLAHDLNFQSERYEAKHQVVSALPMLRCRSVANVLTSDVPKPQAGAAHPPAGVRCCRRKRRAKQGCGQEEEP
jgi:transcription initiation factor IIF auxiliary subunit